jgi:glycosyltransferase involved in cell wall biosynthesis
MPPDIIGGAEVSAFNNAHRQKENGHKVAILTTAKQKDEELHGETIDGIQVWRIFMPRPYPVMDYIEQPSWKKALWHLQDHLDPRNRRILSGVLDSFGPDMVFAHVVQGLGWNMQAEIARRDIPLTQFLHDLSLACYRTSMYRGTEECQKQCAVCRVSSEYKISLLKRLRNLKFISPSKANLDRVAGYVPVHDYPNATILNPNHYPAPTQPRISSDKLKLVYVGRLDALKGVHFLLEVADKLADYYDFHLTLLGGGRDEEALRKQYQNCKWCNFKGFVAREDVSNAMNNADLLCLPSLWFENMPGVAVQALSLGLPVFGSHKGGIKEVVEDGKNGLLLPPGDFDAWYKALEDILKHSEKLDNWRQYAEKNKKHFNCVGAQ